MPVDYYPQKNIEQLQALLDSLQKRQVQGSMTEVSAAGIRTVRDFSGAGASRTETEIKRVLYSLYLRAQADPAAAKLWANPYASMIRRTRARYTFS